MLRKMHVCTLVLGTQDHEDPAEVNEKLDAMGYGIGQRLIDELLAKSNVGQVLTPHHFTIHTQDRRL